MERVTGIGGVFIRCGDPAKLAAWYRKHLGIEFGGETYVNFKWADASGSTVFSFFKKDSSYFAPSSSSFMINFRVKDLDALLELLRQEGVRIEGTPVTEEYGKFAWIMDPEDNKIELWEPLDEKL